MPGTTEILRWMANGLADLLIAQVKSHGPEILELFIHEIEQAKSVIGYEPARATAPMQGTMPDSR